MIAITSVVVSEVVASIAATACGAVELVALVSTCAAVVACAVSVPCVHVAVVDVAMAVDVAVEAAGVDVLGTVVGAVVGTVVAGRAEICTAASMPVAPSSSQAAQRAKTYRPIVLKTAIEISCVTPCATTASPDSVAKNSETPTVTRFTSTTSSNCFMPANLVHRKQSDVASSLRPLFTTETPTS